MITKISIPRGVSLAGSIVHEIARLVAVGKIKPGDRFPPESELAEQLQVGRSSIREAFRVFQMLGVTEAKPGRGTILINTAPLFALIDWSEFTSADLINDIVEARLALEPLIAAMAAKRADAAGLRGIEETIEAGRRAVGNEAASIQASLDFHTAVAVAAGNQTLLLTTRLLRSLYFESSSLSRRHPENYAAVLAAHEEIRPPRYTSRSSPCARTNRRQSRAAKCSTASRI
jgi:GntR family transcriptional repressor for pyruvate dehydrogenase complex